MKLVSNKFKSGGLHEKHGVKNADSTNNLYVSLCNQFSTSPWPARNRTYFCEFRLPLSTHTNRTKCKEHHGPTTWPLSWTLPVASDFRKHNVSSAGSCFHHIRSSQERLWSMYLLGYSVIHSSDTNWCNPLNMFNSTFTNFHDSCCKTRSRPPSKKVPHILYSHLSSLDNLMMAYIQGRNM